MRWAMVLCGERGETERCAIQCCVLRAGRNYAMGEAVLCADRREKMSGVLYSVVC